MYSIYAGDELLYSDVYPLETRKVTSPTLKMGVDEAGSLEFTVSEVNKCYTKLLRMKTIITVKKLNPMTHAEEPIWDGRILREDRDFYKNKKLYVEGALAFLNDSCQPLKEYANKDLEALVTAILNSHNSIVQDTTRELYWGGIADDFKSPQIEYWITKYEYTIDAIKSLADYLGCHFIVKKDPSNGLNKIWFFKNQCGVSNQSIVFTKNLMDYTENYDLSKLATVILPLCKTDRETSDKPINVGTTIDLTTPQPYDDTKGWGVLCPLSKGWAQVKTLYDGAVQLGKNVINTGGDFQAYPEHTIDLNSQTDFIVGDVNVNFSGEYVANDNDVTQDFSLKRLTTKLISIPDNNPPFDPGTNNVASAHAYRLIAEDRMSDSNRLKDIKIYLYYRTKNSQDNWTPLRLNGQLTSGYGLIWPASVSNLTPSEHPEYYRFPDTGKFTADYPRTFGSDPLNIVFDFRSFDNNDSWVIGNDKNTGYLSYNSTFHPEAGHSSVANKHWHGFTYIYDPVGGDRWVDTDLGEATVDNNRYCPDFDTKEWAIRISFTFDHIDDWGTGGDGSEAYFKTRAKFFRLHAIKGMFGSVMLSNNDNVDRCQYVQYFLDTVNYKQFVTDVNSLPDKNGTGFLSYNILNLKRYLIEGTADQYYGKPWAFTKYPLLHNEWVSTGSNGEGYNEKRPYSLSSDSKIFTGDINIRTWANSNAYSTDDINNIRYHHQTINEPENLTLGEAGIGWSISTEDRDYLSCLERLNYGVLKCPLYPNRMPSYNTEIIAGRTQNHSIAVLEIDLARYKSYFVTATIDTHHLIDDDTTWFASVWKIKDDQNIPDWVPLRGRDTSNNTVGFEYDFVRRYRNAYNDQIYTGAVSMSINKSDSNTRMTYEDLVVDDPPTTYVLNPNKYIFVSSDVSTSGAMFEKEMHFYYNPSSDPGFSNRILLCLYSQYGNLSVTLASNDELASVITMGQDSNGIDMSKEAPMRHSETEPHAYSEDTAVRNHVFDETLGYGSIVPPTSSYRLPDRGEFTGMASPKPNVFESGGYYTSQDQHAAYNYNDSNGIVYKTNPDNSNYSVCSFFVKPSYIDTDGKECRKSIYISTSMHGMSAMYAIFELCKADGSAAQWTDNWRPSCKCRAIEYGKYINGDTTYNRKKVTLPICTDKNTLLQVFVASYNSSPSIWLHDPDVSEKESYITIGSANNGNIRLYADQLNSFTSPLQPGGLNDQNGSPGEPPSYKRVRTSEYITITQDGSHALLYDYDASIGTVMANIYVYDQDNTFKYCTGFLPLDPVIFVPSLSNFNKIKVEFRINAGTTGISVNSIRYIRFYHLTTKSMSDLTQGPLKVTADGLSYKVEADPTDVNADKFVSFGSDDYYIANTTDTLALYVASTSIPTTVDVEGVTKDVISAQYYMKIIYQTPSNNTESTDVVYDNYYLTTESYGIIKFTPPTINTRFKAQIRIQVGYMENDQIVYVNAPITPQTVGSIILTPLIKQDYYPPSNALETYGHIEKRIEFEDAESSQELLERAQKYLRQSQFDEMQLKVKALDMTLMGAQVDNLHVGDKINVSSPPHGLYRDFVIREMSIPFDKPENTTFELGWDNKDSLAKLIRKEKSKW